VTGTSLEWLLTGEGDREADLSGPPDSGDDPAVDRLRRLLWRKPELQRSVVGFLDLLEDIAGELPDLKSPTPAGVWDKQALIPVVGSTAAGPAHFWSELETTAGGPEADARLEELLRKQGDRSVQPAELLAVSSDLEQSRQVSLVQLSAPAELGVVEFLSCPSVKAKCPNIVAWRIDGESMTPRYRDGDLVMTSPDQPAVHGHPCVARQKGQIGVNCKIYHREGDTIVLIPVNESSPPQRFPAEDLLWAYRVLYSVRLCVT